MLALTFEQGATIFGMVMTVLGVIAQAIYLVRKFTQAEERIGGKITAVEGTMAHHNEIAGLRFEEMGRRIGRVETTLGGITQVVVFQPNQPKKDQT